MTRENAIFIVVEAQAHAQRAVKRFRTKDSSRYVMHEFFKSNVPLMLRFGEDLGNGLSANSSSKHSARYP